MPIPKSCKTPVHIIDDHHDALPLILRGIGSKYLEFEDNLLIHVDSHPDLLLDLNLTPDDVFDKSALLEKVSIETWILPLAFAKHVTDIVWVRPDWSKQIDDGVYTFYIGETKDKKIKVSEPILYFISALNYSPLEELLNPKILELHVMTANPTSYDRILQLIKKHNNNYLLDVDLDYFYTLNPFLNIYPEVNVYERLTEIYKFESNTNILPAEAQERRRCQIESLENIFESVGKVHKAEDIVSRVNEIVSVVNDDKISELLKTLITDLCHLKTNIKDVDWELIHTAGTTIDDPVKLLPHHPSTELEMNVYMDCFKSILEILPKPRFVTIARSSYDEYCTPQIADYLQGRLCEILGHLFTVDVCKHYQDDTDVNQ